MAQTVTWLSGLPKEFAIWLVNESVVIENVRWPRRVLLTGKSRGHAEYAPSALLRLKKRRDSQTAGRTPDRYITLVTSLDTASVIIAGKAELAAKPQ